MSWTRSPWMRAVALAAAVALVVVHRDRESPWFWVGVGLVVLNVVGLLASRRPRGDESARSHRLSDWSSVPGVAVAFASGPQEWHAVGDPEDLEPWGAEGIARFVWLEEHDGSWSVGFEDEAMPYLDLEVDEVDDPIIQVIRADPRVEDVVHEDREVYAVTLRAPLGAKDFATLVAQAVVAHHVHVSTGS